MTEKISKFKNLKNEKNFIRVIYIIGISVQHFLVMTVVTVGKIPPTQ